MSESISSILDKSLDSIKTGVLSLKATGADGFEGLLRIALTNLTGIPFRLAASGLQGGMDGDAAIPSDPVCFEAKRYSGDISRNDVLVKIADLARRKDTADRLWILGATTEINTQLAKAIQEDGDQNAVSTLILDWTAAPLPLLAIVVVAAGHIAINFIVNNHVENGHQNKPVEDDLKKAFSTISSHPDFESLLQRLKSDLNVSKLALKRAVDLNIEWRQQTFSSTRLARERLGQGLAVMQDQTSPSMRAELRGRILGEIQAGKEVILLGDEGHGKSWLSAQLCSDATGLAIFVSAEQLEGSPAEDIDDFLIKLIIKQTGEIANDTLKLRWRHRLKAWEITPPLASLLVVVDGLNQRQNFRWDKLLNSIQSRIDAIGGRVLVTVRPHFWQSKIVHGLYFTPTVIKVPEWSPKERNELLQHYGISLDWLDQQTLNTLQNPRLLSVAVTTLPHQEAFAWKGLTTDRLLMEHLRASQRENFENETFLLLTNRLSDHATKVLERVQASSSKLPQNFQADSNAVIETRFFQPLTGPGDHYELRDEGLTLALGFTLVDQLWQSLRIQQDLATHIVKLIEPISAMDRTADVLFASLLICALDDIRFDTKIFSALLDAFSNLQNVDDRRFEEFVGIIKHQPKALFDALKDYCLEKSPRINQDWLIHSAFEVAHSETGWQVAEASIHQWLHYYNKDPVAQTSHYHRQSEPEYKKHLAERTSEIEEALFSLSTFEKNLLEQMTEVANNPDELFTLALRLLAGRSLAGFADSFVAMGLAFALDRNVYSARKAFQQLTTFNRGDRTATRNAFLRAIEPLRMKGTSSGGQWTIVRMLYATGEEADARAANILAEELRKDQYHFMQPSPDEWRQVEVANPDAARPVDMNEGVQNFSALDPDKILQTMGNDIADLLYKDFLPVASRFEPAYAIQKTQEILSGLLTRTGLPLRQVILNCEKHLPLVDSNLAKSLINRLLENDAFETLPEQDQSICRMYAFYYAAAHISANEQLKCITNKNCGPACLLSVIPSLKPQQTETITTAIQVAFQKNDQDAVYGALVASLFGYTKINDELEKLILKCFHSESPKLRAVTFELAIQQNLEQVRKEHAFSNWNAATVDENTLESWLGSMLLVEAYVRHEVSVEELLDRISKKTWLSLPNRLGTEFTKSLASCFVQQLRRGIVASCKIRPPLADLHFSKTELRPFPLLSIEETDRESERFPKQKDPRKVLGTNNNFDENQRKLRTFLDAFFKDLKESDARLLVQEITIESLQRLVTEVPTLLEELVDILDQAGSDQFTWLKNLAFAVGNLISVKLPDNAVTLLNRACLTQGFITQALGDDLTLEHQAIWGSAASMPMEALWYQRLLNSKNDATLAREVLAAERYGAAEFIKSFIISLASSEDSLDQAYALSIAGYSTQSDKFIDFINSHINCKSICGQAAKYALQEHNSAKWTRKWIADMWDATTPEELWRCLMIAKTSMDARVNAKTPINSKWTHYGPMFRNVRKAAIKERNTKRVKRLLGQEAPESIFIPPTHMKY